MQASVGDGFESLGFSPEFEVDSDPEFPSAGVWPYPTYAFDGEGRIVEEFTARWGSPTIVVVDPAGAPPWVGMFPSGGMGGPSGVVAMPNPRHLLVAVGGRSYVLDVDRPQSGAVTGWVQQIVGASGLGLLLTTSMDDVTAYGMDGLLWRSPRVAVDGLKVVSVEKERIVVSDRGSYTRHAGELTEIDPRTGKLVN